jgi:hypothetical protein
MTVLKHCIRRMFWKWVAPTVVIQKRVERVFNEVTEGMNNEEKIRFARYAIARLERGG